MLFSTRPSALNKMIRGWAFVLAALLVLCCSAAAQAGPLQVELNGLSNGGNAITGTFRAQDGSNSVNENVYIDQFKVTYNSETYYTFCIDLFHNVSIGQKYAVDLRTDLASAFTRGGQMAALYYAYGDGNMAGDPQHAAALQLALWDLAINDTNHDPFTFTTSAGVIKTDDGDFKVSNLSADFSAIASDFTAYMSFANAHSSPGGWLDASAQGNYRDRGQSLLLPTPAPEPSSLVLAGIGCVSLLGIAWRRRRCQPT
jgi:hypothetical protein